MDWKTLDEFEGFVRESFRRWQRGCVNTVSIDGGYRRFKIYTRDNEYSITARSPGENEIGRGYLGCVATARRARAGESHLRGSDLADGPFCADTWHRILADIIAYELEPIADPVERRADVAFLQPAAAGAQLGQPSAMQAIQETVGQPSATDLAQADQSPRPVA